jgi:glutamate dehydrogenase
MPGDIDGVVDDEVFLRRYLAHASLELPNHDQAERIRIAHVHRGQGEVRSPSETQVRLRDIDGDTTAIEIVTDDAPYLVDSVQSELKITGHPVENVLHPLLVVSRNESGKITHLYDIDDTSPQPPNSMTEAWIFIEVSRVDSAEFDEIASNLQRVIGDVHNVERDTPELHKLFGKLADKLARDPGQFDRVTSQEAGELLRWLADGNFVILGHASFSSNELASAGNQAVEHQVRGVLRGEATVTPREVLPALRDLARSLSSDAPAPLFPTIALDRQQFLVGHAGPKEITQPAGQIVIGEWTNSRTGFGEINAVSQIRRDQNTDQGFPNGRFMIQPFCFPASPVIRQQIVLLLA